MVKKKVTVKEAGLYLWEISCTNLQVFVLMAEDWNGIKTAPMPLKKINCFKNILKSASCSYGLLKKSFRRIQNFRLKNLNLTTSAEN